MGALFGAGFKGVVNDELSNAFNNGKVFRSFYELDLAANATQVFKFEVSGDVVLESSAIDIDDGGVSYKVYAGGTDSGAFTPLPIIPTNSTSGTPSVTSSVSIGTGGDYNNDGMLNDVTRVLAANANSKQSTVGAVDGDSRGFPATTAYVVVENLAGVSGGSKGTIKWLWRNK